MSYVFVPPPPSERAQRLARHLSAAVDEFRRRGRFVAVGGSRVAPELIDKARGVGLPVYEGYGLSECGSVVSLNVVGHTRTGTAGRALPHARLDIDDGEIIVRGSAMLGYVDQPESWNPREIRTGDLGHIDSDGFVHIDGRASNLLITSFGRNISPEWVESELLAGPLLAQAVVVGDARPWCAALVYGTAASSSDADIGAWIQQVNLRLCETWKEKHECCKSNTD